MKMNLKNLNTARIVLAAVVVFSSVFQGIFGLKGLYRDIQKGFYEGLSAQEPALYEDMRDAVEFGALIKKVAVANDILAKDSSYALAVDDAYNDFNESDTLKDCGQAFVQLQNAVADVIQKMDESTLDADVRKSYDQYKAEYEESLSYISHSSLNDSIQEYNEVLSEFPASLFSVIAGVDELKDYR